MLNEINIFLYGNFGDSRDFSNQHPLSEGML